MKKIILLSLALSPISLFAQAPSIDNGNGLGFVLLVLLICILIFIVCRELVCWYYKINKMVSNQDEIIRLLKKIAGEDKNPNVSNNQDIVIDPFHRK